MTWNLKILKKLKLWIQNLNWLNLSLKGNAQFYFKNFVHSKIYFDILFQGGVMKRAACRRPRKRQWSTSTTLSTGRRQPAFFNLPFSNGRRRPCEKCRIVCCLFLLVDVNLPFSNWSTCLFLTGRRSTSIDAHRRIDVRQRPFSALFITPFQGLFCAKKLVSLICLRLLLLMAHLHIRFGNYFFVFVKGCSLGWTVL